MNSSSAKKSESFDEGISSLTKSGSTIVRVHSMDEKRRARMLIDIGGGTSPYSRSQSGIDSNLETLSIYEAFEIPLLPKRVRTPALEPVIEEPEAESKQQ
mmetsp:Transcript_12587/g.22690  ORF Transcript_12587/g.22690 Transcript_12587/m.22690 type:complete len:100 (-) Transcript_12587:113-412(-)